MPIRVYRCREGHETEVSIQGSYPKAHPCAFCIDDAAKSVPGRIAISTTVGEQIQALRKRGLIPYEKGMEQDARSTRQSKLEKEQRRYDAIVDTVVRERQDIRPD